VAAKAFWCAAVQACWSGLLLQLLVVVRVQYAVAVNCCAGSARRSTGDGHTGCVVDPGNTGAQQGVSVRCLTHSIPTGTHRCRCMVPHDRDHLYAQQAHTVACSKARPAGAWVAPNPAPVLLSMLQPSAEGAWLVSGWQGPRMVGQLRGWWRAICQEMGNRRPASPCSCCCSCFNLVQLS
jgi:hypothetical protein